MSSETRAVSLTELPDKVTVLPGVSEGDIVVLSAEHQMEEYEREDWFRIMSHLMPKGVRLIILDRGMTLDVLKVRR